MSKNLFFRVFLSLTLLFCIDSQTLAQRIRVACVGNSVTYGYLLPNRELEAYPSRLQEALGKNYEVGNFGHSGATLLSRGHRPYIQQQAYKDALAFKADKVIIHLGLNDTDPRNWNNYRDEFIPNYCALIDTFRAVNPKAEVWICQMSPIFNTHPRFSSGTLTWHKQVQEAIKEVASRKNVKLIDLETPLHNRPDLFPDALHPTAEGAQILANTVYSAITGDYGGLLLPNIFSEGMVLQSGSSYVFRGKANANELVEVTLNGKKISQQASDMGDWEISLPLPKAGGPYRLTFKTKKRTIDFKQVWVGEVWLCSGQSNMEFMLKQTSTAQKDIAEAKNYSNIHFYNMQARWETYNIAWSSSALDSINRLEYFRTSGWETCTPQTASNFSAIAYHFGRYLSDSLKVPIGIVCNAVGGSNTESWIDRRTLEEELPAILSNFSTSDYIMDWCRTRAKQNIANATSKMQRHPFQPSYLFEAGIEPLLPFKFAGVAWYQGESNAHNIELHEQLFSLLTKSWRTHLQYNSKTTLPVLYVQLSSIGTRPSWPQFRFSQLAMADPRKSLYMAVSSDLGDSLDVHPRTKAPIGERLGRQALHNVYNFHHIENEGPRPYEAFIVDGSKTEKDMLVRIYFHHAKGLQCTQGFEISDENKNYIPVQVVAVKDNEVTLRCPKVKSDLISIRYGWQPFTRGDLKNSSGLPASTFEIFLSSRAVGILGS